MSDILYFRTVDVAMPATPFEETESAKTVYSEMYLAFMGHDAIIGIYTDALDFPACEIHLLDYDDGQWESFGIIFVLNKEDLNDLFEGRFFTLDESGVTLVRADIDWPEDPEGAYIAEIEAIFDQEGGVPEMLDEEFDTIDEDLGYGIPHSGHAFCTETGDDFLPDCEIEEAQAVLHEARRSQKINEMQSEMQRLGILDEGDTLEEERYPSHNVD